MGELEPHVEDPPNEVSPGSAPPEVASKSLVDKTDKDTLTR